MAWGTLELKYSQILEFLLTMWGEKERNVKYCLMTRLTTECVISLGFVGLLPSFFLLPHAELFVQGGCARLKSID